jgi:sugar phosphate isomerase/epimerase
MRLDRLPGEVHLTYCTNIHGGETWPQVHASLKAHVPGIKARISPAAPMGVGLRLSAIAAEELARPAAFGQLREFLASHDLYVFTINAFPYGSFHGTTVKENVYQPDWLTAERVAYSNRVAGILAALLPQGMTGSISSVPGTFKSIARSPGAAPAMAANIARTAAQLIEILDRTGREIILALEPEPCCFLETMEETLAFFRDHLFSNPEKELVAQQAGISLAAAADALRRHVGVCYDVCHGAVEYEDPAAAFAAFERAGIRVAKVQLSSALRLPSIDATTEGALSAFDDGVYLHQVVEKRGGAINRFVDLAPAFSALRAGNAGGEWRVHCHVPIFLESAGSFQSTQPTLKAALACTRNGFVAPHLEVETYTWSVLPPQLRHASLVDAIAQEMQWVKNELRC